MDKTIEIDDALVKAAQDLTGEVDERTAVESVIRLAASGRSAMQSSAKSMFDLVGKIRLRDDYDYKSMRENTRDPD